MLPIRCFSCNKILGCYEKIFEDFKKNRQIEEDMFKNFFQLYDIKRYCCRKIFTTHIDIYTLRPLFPHENIICKSKSETKNIIIAE